MCQIATSTLHALGLHWWPQQRGDGLGTPASWDVPQENVPPPSISSGTGVITAATRISVGFFGAARSEDRNFSRNTSRTCCDQ